MVPGTGFNAAVALPWLRALSARWATTVVDLPGQPGLSDPHRPRRGRLAWYGRVLDEVLTVADLDRVVLVGNSLGAAVALAAGSPRIAARALVSPAGLIRLTVDPALALGLRECQIFCARGFSLSGTGCLSGVLCSRYLMPSCPVYPAASRNRTYRCFRGQMLRVPVFAAFAVVPGARCLILFGSRGGPLPSVIKYSRR